MRRIGEYFFKVFTKQLGIRIRRKAFFAILQAPNAHKIPKKQKRYTKIEANFERNLYNFYFHFKAYFRLLQLTSAYFRLLRLTSAYFGLLQLTSAVDDTKPYMSLKILFQLTSGYFSLLRLLRPNSTVRFFLSVALKRAKVQGQFEGEIFYQSSSNFNHGQNLQHSIRG